MRAKEFTFEASLGTNPKRPARQGSRPERGHEPLPRYKHISPSGVATDMNPADDDYEINYGKEGLVAKFRKEQGLDVKTGSKKVKDQDVEEGRASRALCLSSKPDDELGASNLASCKSQGLRARDGNKSHKLGKSPKSRVKVGGHKIKGKKYGGPLPDWS